MKRYLLLPIISFIAFSISAQERNYDFGSKIEVKKKEKLVESPYTMFGDNTVVLQTKHEDEKDHTLKIPIVKNEKQDGIFKLDFQTGTVSMFDMNGNLSYNRQLTIRELARFTSIDPHAENYYSWSPYAYVGNNPIRITDPTGKDWFVDGTNGSIYFIRGEATLTEDLAKKWDFNISDFSKIENLGADNMFGDQFYYTNIDHGPNEDGSYTFVKEDMSQWDVIDLHSSGAAGFMYQQGYDHAQIVTSTTTRNIGYTTDGVFGQNTFAMDGGGTTILNKSHSYMKNGASPLTLSSTRKPFTMSDYHIYGYSSTSTTTIKSLVPKNYNNSSSSSSNTLKDMIIGGIQIASQIISKKTSNRK